MTMPELAQAVRLQSNGHIPTGHDVLNSLRRYFSRQPQLQRSNGRIRLSEWSQFRFAAAGLKRTVPQEIEHCLARYGSLPFRTLAATVADATGRAAKYAEQCIRHPKADAHWQVLPNQMVVLRSQTRHPYTPEPDNKEVCPPRQIFAPPADFRQRKQHPTRPGAAGQSSPTYAQGARK